VIAEGRDATREMLVAILGCNLAWGLIDAGMYIMTSLFERGRNARWWVAIREARDETQALSIIRSEMDAQLTAVTSEAARTELYADMLSQLRRQQPPRTRIIREDLYGAITSFWLVFASTIPAIVPFLIFDRLHFALRVSNGLLLVMLFMAGYRWGVHTNVRAWLAGMAMLTAGALLVGVAMALGG
jgi:VIT1/CCC1 family predicted Fe2+/Mn2+ transporter